MTDLVPVPRTNLPERFIASSQAVFLGQQASSTISPQDLVEIASNSNLRDAFIYRFNQDITDQNLKNLIIDYVEDTAEALDNNINNTEAVIELVDRASFPIATAAVLSGIGLFASVGVFFGPIAIFAGGLIGLAASGTGRTILRMRTNRNKSAIKKLYKFASKLRGR
ncbi:hypothetical protein [Methylobacterium sp. Leaf469]|uniref:hypothetical protein n=1 Tax=Methylobacterium sp. Leaf469 TaxID=1736387 RepID=UPI0012E377D5|nr:hypothetical protein [Methylobacterium sp. Leaf469]